MRCEIPAPEEWHNWEEYKADVDMLGMVNEEDIDDKKNED